MNKYIDHTLLKADATKQQIDDLIAESIEYNFKAVCLNPSWVAYAHEQLINSDVLVCTVIGFPLGANTTTTKVFETKDAIKNGADEIDMVINIGKLIDGDYSYVREEIANVVLAADGHIVKAIIETALLSEEQIIAASKLIVEAKADFVKTSTGFASRGATIEDVILIKKTIGDDALIKAAGGVRSPKDLVDMIVAGADRIGTSSGVKLINKEDACSNEY